MSAVSNVNPWEVKATSGQAGGEKRELPDEGAHPGVVVALVDLGTHDKDGEDEKTGRKWTSAVRRLYVAYELTDCPMSGMKGRNHLLCRDYTLNLGESAALRKLLAGFGKKFADGDSFDVRKLLGLKCLVNVVHKTSAAGNVYAKIASVGPPPRGLPVPEPKAAKLVWTLGDDEAALADLPWLMGKPVKDEIAACHERRRAAPPQQQPGPDSRWAGQEPSEAADGADDDNPFRKDNVPF